MAELIVLNKDGTRIYNLVQDIDAYLEYVTSLGKFFDIETICRLLTDLNNNRSIEWFKEYKNGDDIVDKIQKLFDKRNESVKKLNQLGKLI